MNAKLSLPELREKLAQLGYVDPERDAFRQRVLQEAREHLREGVALDQLIEILHDRGVSIVESVWVLNQAAGLSLKDGKLRVTAHPVWDSLVRATEPLHDELEKMLLDWQRESGNGSE